MIMRRSMLLYTVLLCITASLVPLVLSSCSRNEETPTDSTTNPQKTLELLSSYSLSVTEPSGLAYDPVLQRLYMISDNRPEIFVIDTTGRVLGSIPVTATDIEAIAVAPTGDTLYIVEETASRVSTVLMNGQIIDTMSVLVRTDPKHSLEGMTIGRNGHRVVINEKTPTMLVEFSGKSEVQRMALSYSTDLSDICYEAAADCYWVISDESQKVMKISRSGALLGEWRDTAAQGEGIAFIGDRMYVVSDSEAKMYVYRKPTN